LRNQPLANHQWRLLIGLLRDSQAWRICLWLRRNGIDPRLVPDDTEITIHDGQIFYEEFVDTSRRETRSVPLAVPPPPGDIR
jgi:hypothetical protein